jgi:hypothetical protein
MPRRHYGSLEELKEAVVQALKALGGVELKILGEGTWLCQTKVKRCPGDLAQGAADRGMTRLGYPRVGGVYPFMSLSRPDCFRPTHLEER